MLNKLTSSSGHQPFPIRRHIATINLEVLPFTYTADISTVRSLLPLDPQHFPKQHLSNRNIKHRGLELQTSMRKPNWLDDMHCTLCANSAPILPKNHTIQLRDIAGVDGARLSLGEGASDSRGPQSGGTGLVDWVRSGVYS